ncbi:hypothetical protein ACO0K0_07440 [Undibacterium sp. SXout11W]|uniref:hypothetical protein n=1 Tax=Undibacterium sp. SXout11W TaxID=3413050 RepID=UPI003BEFE14B
MFAKILDRYQTPFYLHSEGEQRRIEEGVVHATNGIHLLKGFRFGSEIESNATHVLNTLNTYIVSAIPESLKGFWE